MTLQRSAKPDGRGKSATPPGAVKSPKRVAARRGSPKANLAPRALELVKPPAKIVPGKPSSTSDSSRGTALVRVTVSPDAIEDTVAEIVQFSRAGNLAMTLQIGEIVFRKIFGGDIAAVRDRGPKDASFARLAKHPRLPFSSATLWRSVASYELTCRFPGIARSKHLGITHLSAVFNLPGDVQERLLRAAEKEKWSREDVERRARVHRENGTAKRGRRPLAPLIRCVNVFEKLVSTGALVKPELTSVLDDRAATRAREVVVELRAWCDAIDAMLLQATATA